MTVRADRGTIAHVRASTQVIDVKLARDLGERGSKRLLRAVPGVQRVVHTFAGDADADLGSLYLIFVDTAQAVEALEHLHGHGDVEYAEVAPGRALMQSR